MATARTFTAGKFALALDGVACGFVESVDGGDISADVIESAVGSTFFAKKTIGQPKYEDFTLQIGLGLANPVYDWIAATLNGNYLRKDGAVTTADANLNAQAESQFSKALIHEVGFPALDAASKDASHLTIKFSPELTKFAQASGKVPAAGGKQKAFVGSNFRLELDGIDCSHVRAIDAFTVVVGIVADTTGDSRDVAIEPGRVEVPNVHVTITDGPTAASWQLWFEDFVVKGNNDESKEKTGTIVYLGPDLKTELGRVVLHNVGICALRHGKQDANAGAVRTLVAELYCERVELQIGKQAPTMKPVEQPVVPVAPVTPVASPIKPLGIRR